jgi:phenylacetate-CoA ligase
MNISVLRRNLFEPLYLKKSNSPKISYWRELEKTQYYSTDELKNIQWQRLQKLWNFVWRNNSYYKKRFLEYGLNENSLKFPDDIRLLPVLTKKEIRDNSDTMISNGFDKNKLLHFKTGGSTGKALDIYITEEGSEMRNACARRHDRWTGWEPGEPIAAAWGNPKLPKTVKEKNGKLFYPAIYLSGYNGCYRSLC